jgi:hypothetical protein
MGRAGPRAPRLPTSSSVVDATPGQCGQSGTPVGAIEEQPVGCRRFRACSRCGRRGGIALESVRGARVPAGTLCRTVEEQGLVTDRS